MRKILLLAACYLFILTCGYAERDVEVKLNQIYGEIGSRKLELDLYQPKGEGPFPGILILHGGGWVGGSRKKHDEMSLELAALGYVVANADYRLATEAKFPGAVSDGKAAVRWMRANAKLLKLNPNKIIGAGFSAGGHLISMLATTAGEFEGEAGHSNYSSRLQGAFVMGAGVDQVARVEESKNREVKNCLIFLGAGIDENLKIYQQASPIYHVDKNTAPFFFYDGELDRPGKRYIEMRKKLDEVKVDNYFEMLPGLKHGAWNKPAFRSTIVKKLDSFVKLTN